MQYSSITLANKQQFHQVLPCKGSRIWYVQRLFVQAIIITYVFCIVMFSSPVPYSFKTYLLLLSSANGLMRLCYLYRQNN